MSKSILFSVLFLTALPSYAAQRSPAGDVVSVLGKVIIRQDLKPGQDSPAGLRNARPGDVVFTGDVINTASNAGVKILLKDHTVIDLGASSLFKISEFKKQNDSDRQVELDMAYGSVRTAVTEKLKGQSKFKLRTPSAVMGVRGTVAYSEVAMGDGLKSVSGFLGGSGKRPASPEGQAGGIDAKTTFLITQGQGVVTPTSGRDLASGRGVVLNPGDQASTSAATQGAQGAGLMKATLSPEQFSQRVAEVQNLSRANDTAFVLATNFDRAMEQKQAEQKTEPKSEPKADQKESQKSDRGKDQKLDQPDQKSEQKADQKPDQKSADASKDQKAETAQKTSAQKPADQKTKEQGSSQAQAPSEQRSAGANQGGSERGPVQTAALATQGPSGAESSSGNRGPASNPAMGPASSGLGGFSGGSAGGGFLQNLTSQMTQNLPPPVPLTISNLGVSGAPTNSQVLNQQAGSSTPQGLGTKRLNVQVRW